MTAAAGPSNGRPHSLQSVARALLALVLVGTAVLAGWVLIDLFAVRQLLATAQGGVSDARQALGAFESQTTAAELSDAREALDEASRRSQRLTWSIAAQVPYLGPTVVVTRQVVEVADVAVEVLEVAVSQGGELLTADIVSGLEDGRLDLQPLLAVRELVAALPIQRLTAARNQLAVASRAWLPAQVRDGRTNTLALADELLGSLTQAKALTEALPDFFGASGARRYFVGMQTSAELRGTGGLIGFWAVLSVDDGRFDFSAGEAYDPFDDTDLPEGETRLDRIRTIGLAPTNPPDIDEAFLGRYATTAAGRSFPNINLDPDLPTVSKAILDLFELQTGERLDGVVLVDPQGVERLLETTTAPLVVDPELAAATGLEEGLPVERFASFVNDEIYNVLGFDRGDERKLLLSQLGDEALKRLISGEWDAAQMVGAVADATRERHLQVFSTAEHVQAGFVAVNATGSLQAPPDADLIALTANNVVGGKQDVHLGYTSEVAVNLNAVQVDADGSLSVLRDLEIGVRVDNPLPSSGRDVYVIGNCYVPDAANRCFEGETGANRTWFSLWLSPLTRATGFTSDDGAPPTRLAGRFRDLTVVDHFLLTPSEGHAGFVVEAEGTAPLQRDIDSVVYELLWWRQAKAIPDLLELTVTPPPGWSIGGVAVVGGGVGRGTGVHGDGVPLAARVIDGVGQVRGTVTADTRVRVQLVDPDDVAAWDATGLP